MNSNYRLMRKSYAMLRMGLAIDRAVTARTSKQKASAAKWAAAWGLLCGIRIAGVKLKRSVVMDANAARLSARDFADIPIPPMQKHRIVQALGLIADAASVSPGAQLMSLSENPEPVAVASGSLDSPDAP